LGLLEKQSKTCWDYWETVEKHFWSMENVELIFGLLETVEKTVGLLKKLRKTLRVCLTD
jgi:hypothetical protein